MRIFSRLRTFALAFSTGALLSGLAPEPGLTATSSPPLPKIIDDIPFPAGAGPLSIAINTKTNRVYVGNIYASSVTVIDGSTDKIITTIPVIDSSPSNGYANGPSGLSVDEATNTIYVGMSNGSIAIVNGQTNQVTSVFSLNLAPPVFSNNQAYNSKTGILYYQATLANDSSEITVVNVKAQKVAGHIPDPDASQVAIDTATNKIYISQYWEGTVWVVDGNTNLLDYIINNVGQRAEPEGCWLEITQQNCYINASSELDGITVDETLHRAYAFGDADGVVSTIDTTKNLVINSIHIDGSQFNGAVNTNNNTLYTIGSIYAFLALVDGQTGNLITKDIPDGDNTSVYGDISGGVAVNPVNGKIYVTHLLITDHVTVLQAP